MKKYCMRCMRQIEKGNICPLCGEFSPQQKIPHLLLPGTILKDRYLVGNVLGQGGFGITYIGRDLLLNMRVAIKEYYPNGYANRNVFSSANVTVANAQQAEFMEAGKDKFLREARVLAEFHDEEGIVDVRDYFKENNTAYIVMEYLDGITLRQSLNATNIAPDLIVDLISPVLDSLEKIHAKQVIHRDISPDNIMLLRSGKLKLMDFGAARQVDFSDQKSMSVVLKTGFAPVEQYRPRGELGPWTDVYALCATIYMCITGERPDNALERVFSDSVKWPSELGINISVDLENVIKKGMEISWRDRYHNIAELREALAGARKASTTKEFDASKGRKMPDTSIALETDRDALSALVSTILAKESAQSTKESYPLTGGKEDDFAETIAAIDEEESDDSSMPVKKNEKAPKRGKNEPRNKLSRQKQCKQTGAKGRSKIPTRLSSKVIIGTAILAVAIVICVAVALFAGNLVSDDNNDYPATPTHIVMMSDAKQILDDAGISGVITSLNIQEDTYSEKFGVYRAECEVIMSGHADPFAIILIYDQKDDSWILNSQSRLS